MRRERFKKNCLQCKNIFEVINARLITAKYCSKECHNNSQIVKKIIKKCLHCSNIFFIEPHRKKTALFCSASCHSKNTLKNYWQNKDKKMELIKRMCIQCKTNFSIPKHKLKFKKANFCSRKCFYSNLNKFGHSESARSKIKEARMKQILPVKNTSIEIKIQNYLKQLKIDFFTHHYIKNITHGYQCDVFIPSLNLVIECDGNYWHKYPTGTETDHIRTKELIENGFKVLRLWESEIKNLTLEEFNIKLNDFIKGKNNVGVI